MKRVFVLLTVALAACADVTGTPTSEMKGMWTLRQFAGQTLPALEYTVDSDSVFVAADTLWLDGRGSYTSASWISVRTPSGTTGSGTAMRGSYTAVGDDVMLHLSVPYLLGFSTWGHRIGDVLFFPAEPGSPSSILYRR